ncbi:MAG: 4a-hydroxytetrahydrobiopterin dehydratase [Vicinamibacterales bacterium]
MARLRDDEIDRALGALPGWSRQGDALVRQFTFAGFPEAVAFVSRLVAPAEAADHHPDLTINYRRVSVSYSTHSEGGVTEKDVAGAREADRAAVAR